MEREEIVRSLQYNMTNAFIEGWYEKNHERYTEEIEEVFYEGAEAAQKYLIEKACKWLGDNTHFYVSDFTGTLDENKLIEDFKKAMEE